VADNPDATWVTRMQEWDYRLGINGVKRMQAAYNTTLVAQGAFSAYSTENVRAAGGWPDAIGEDIVLTWTLLDSQGLVQYEPVALGFTTVPEKLGRLLSQRSRWARGMFEGLLTYPPRKQPRVLAKLVAGIDYLVPFLDIGVIFFFVPGVILLAFGYPIISAGGRCSSCRSPSCSSGSCAPGRNAMSSGCSASIRAAMSVASSATCSCTRS
jgi:biofilm PGA synthesis N-glycosyltransferase PgaC